MATSILYVTTKILNDMSVILYIYNIQPDLARYIYIYTKAESYKIVSIIQKTHINIKYHL